MSQTKIIGAGLSGLMLACVFPEAEIYEATPQGEPHKALLRFRSDEVSQLTGIPFRKVTVHKAIHFEGHTYTTTTPRLANLYSRKVVGRLAGDRSIWDLDTVDRWVAPEDFQAQLVHRHMSRIHWSKPIMVLKERDPTVIINTAPLPSILAAAGLKSISADFESSPIDVVRYRLPEGTDVYQTLYFPQQGINTFRASITGDLLIIESMKRDTKPEASDLSYVCAAFGLDPAETVKIEKVSQRYGKIVDISVADRESILHRLSTDFNVFSVGRFACWRNILLDDVVHDIKIVQRLIAASAYDRRLVLAKR